MHRLVALVLVTSAMVWVPYAGAVSYGFDCITNNAAADCGIGEDQLSVDVTEGPVGQVLFTFNNVGPDASSITDVYFDDGSLLALAGLIDADDGVGGNAGVDFSQDASPPDLPGGNPVGFTTTAGFLADSDAPAQPNGVNPGESLGVLFTLQGSLTIADVLADLASGALRIGIHVQGFNGGGSESFVNAVPLPAAAWLFITALAGLFGMRRLQKPAAV